MRGIRSELEEHLVLFFEDQSLTPVQQRDFAARDEAREVMILAHDETYRANSDRWHNDVTFLETPPQAAVLYAEQIPEVGGDTLWANMYLAYEALSEPIETLVAQLRAVRSFAKNFTPERFKALGIEDQRDRMCAEHPPVSHPVARTNPATGRRALFVNRDFTSHIEGLSARASDALLRLLFEHMERPEFQVRWRWNEGTVAFWDNRWPQRCALADYFPNRRHVRRATILGERPV